MEVADLVLPVFAVIVTGWLAGWLGYISRSLADGLVHFAYNVAMPALLFVTVAQEPARNLLEWRFLMAFGGGSVLCFALVFLAVRIAWGRDLASSTIQGMTAAMTNTGFVALPILHSIYGQPAVLPAAIATVFVAAVMFPATVILLESEGRGRHGPSARPVVLVKQIVLNPMVLSTLVGLAWAIAGWPIPAPIAAYLNIFAACAHPVRALRHRAWPVGRRHALEARGVHRVGGRQARGHAAGRVRPVRGLGPQSALHHCRRRLRRRADCEDGVHPRRRVQGGGAAGHRHGLDHDAAVGRHAAGLALRPFGPLGTGSANCPGRVLYRANPHGRQGGEPADGAVHTDAAARRRGDRIHQLNSCTEFVAVHEFGTTPKGATYQLCNWPARYSCGQRWLPILDVL